MALTAGTRLGPYEITAQIGAGGMGEVYKARDTKLDRSVAIKILPESLARDPDRLARFEREAKTLASLNHPNIAIIHGFEETDGIKALVMELVEGPTLAARIAQSPIPHDEALPIAKQIAEALEAAHDQGVVHRDLKPANIKLRPDGAVKVLDFGLAKTVSHDGPASDLSQSPTVTAIGTQQGIILGTAAYMSPEQARGRSVDKRSDIWAFGCVLYEMLTGRSPFAGGTFTDTAARILEREPDWRALPASAPPNILPLLQRCLTKDLRRRLHDVADARIEIDEALSGAWSSRASAPASKRRAVLGGAGLAAAALTVAAYLASRSPEPDSPAASPPRFTFSQLTSHPGAEWFPSLSPDGKWVVYSGEASGNRDIFLQSVGGQNPINLTAEFPEDDDQPAFSPDGERIAFRSSRLGGGIFVMGRTGEGPRRVTSEGFRPAWSPDGTMLVYSTDNVDVNPQNSNRATGLRIVDVKSGETRDLNVPNGAQVSVSPDGKRLAVTTRNSDARQMDIVTVPLAGGEPTTVVTSTATDWNPAWSPDGRYLYFTSDRGGSMNLWRVLIDGTSGGASGEPEPITTPSPFAVHPAISSDGRLLAFSAVTTTTNVAKLTFDPATGTVEGQPLDVTEGSRPWSSPDPSPNGQWVAFYSGQNPVGDVYVQRADGTGLRQVTSDAAIDRVPRWSPDSNWIAFFSNRSGPYAIWKIHADGSNLQQLTEDGSSYPTWSPDGSRIAVAEFEPKPNTYVFETNRPWKGQSPEILPPPPSADGVFMPNSWSPDGQRIAGQIGRATEGIATYSLRSRSFEALTDFGEWPVWLPDSRRILFVAGGTDFLVIDTVTKRRRTVYTGTREVLGPPRLTGDGRAAYFTRRITASDIWLVKIE